MDQAGDAQFAHSLQHVQRAEDVGADVALGREVGIGNGDQGAEVEDDLAVAYGVEHAVAVGEVAASDVDLAPDRRTVQPAGVAVRGVADQDADLGPDFYQPFAQPAADEAARSSDQDRSAPQGANDRFDVHERPAVRKDAIRRRDCARTVRIRV